MADGGIWSRRFDRHKQGSLVGFMGAGRWITGLESETMTETNSLKRRSSIDVNTRWPPESECLHPSFSWIDLRIGLGIPAFSLRPVKLNLIYWFDAVNIPFLWNYPCFDLLSSVANWVHVTNSCFLLSQASFCFDIVVVFLSIFLFFLNMSGLQNENSLHTNDSRTLVVCQAWQKH